MARKYPQNCGHDPAVSWRVSPNGNGYCSVCHRSLTDKWAKRNPEKRRRTNKRAEIRMKYKITLEEYERILSVNPVCQICGTNDFGKRGKQLDHDHNTNRIRGVLCHKCNLGIGLLRDSISILASASKYLASSYV